MYARVPLPHELSAPLAAASDRLHPFGVHIVYFDEVGSTNDVAADLARTGAAEGTIVLASGQTRGRGRSGRSWFSPRGAGLYVSIVLRPAEVVYGASTTTPAWVGLLTLAAGVALAEGIRAATGLALEVKWPNDLVAAEGAHRTAAGRRWRKVAGILAEGHTIAGELRHVVLGYGINLQPAAYPLEIADRASSLASEAGRPVDAGAVLVDTLAAVRREYYALRRGEYTALLTRWRDWSPSADGARVAFHEHEVSREAVTAGVDETGGLVVESDGRRIVLRAGEVTWL